MASRSRRVNTPQPQASLAPVGGKGATTTGGGKENILQARRASADVELHPGGGRTSATPAPTRAPIPRSQVVLPLDPSTLVEAKWRDDKFHAARVVDRRPVQGGAPDEWEYYMHFRGFNRRMDMWVPLASLDLDTVIPPEPMDPSDPKSKKRRMLEEHSDDEGEHEGINLQDLRTHEELTKVKNIEILEMGQYQMETWYFCPLPPEFSGVTRLYVCEYDLAFFKRREQMLRHLRKVRLQHPPGVEIYRHNGIAMFEVDGAKAKMYCQNLCYLAKLFLDHKTLQYDVDPFLFYVMCEFDERGAHPVGYFSKEKISDNNLACILTFPSYQRRGYGKFLISFSYELSKIEGKVGSPERPLSDLGLVSYRGYWARTMLNLLKDKEGSVSIKELSDMTMIKPEDSVSTLQHLGMIQYIKGQHVICAAPHVIETHLRKCGSPGALVEPAKIVWSPFDARAEQYK